MTRIVKTAGKSIFAHFTSSGIFPVKNHVDKFYSDPAIPVIPRKGEIVSLKGLRILESEEFADLEPFLFTVDLVSYTYESGKWKVTLILSGE